MTTNKKETSQNEFILLMACLMSIVALSIDTILPALNPIGLDIGTVNQNENQLLITMIFLGLGFGQLIFGPISDSFGRKPVVYIGFVVFVLASFLCVSASTIKIMVVGRILQGIGLSASRSISIAMIRDRFEGDYEMAYLAEEEVEDEMDIQINNRSGVLYDAYKKELVKILTHYFNQPD